MASGKKNYFRHSFFARNDDFIIRLIEEMGYQGYFLWFSLLEVCGEIASDSYPEKFKIHNSRLLRSLRCRQDKLDSFLTLAQLESRLSWERVENNHFIQIHNFKKFLGKYDNLNRSNSPKEKKEKEKKEKEIKSAEESASVDVGPKKILPDVKHEENLKPTLFAPEAPALEEETSLSDLERNALTALNSICGKSFRPTPGNMKFIKARIKEGYNFEDFVKVIKFKFGQWGNDPKFRTFLRPETIFGTKFDSYLAEASDDRLKAIEADRLIREFFPGFTA